MTYDDYVNETHRLIAMSMELFDVWCHAQSVAGDFESVEFTRDAVYVDFSDYNDDEDPEKCLEVPPNVLLDRTKWDEWVRSEHAEVP